MNKLPYEAPIVRSHGKVEDITKGGSTGLRLDASFPAGTPFGDLTLS
ncbi:lasso RiPP family leader peptide-containing protein [Marivita sp.]|nr:lasso RiPP family leader peptide-containing protein [Marivita sp.]